MGGIFAEEGDEFIEGEDVEGALAFFVRVGGIDDGVGVFGGEEAAVGVGQVAEDVLEDVAGDLRVEGVAGDLEGFEIGEGELGLIVEHFLEVGDEPVSVDGVAVEAAAELVVHAALGHFAQGEESHVEGFFLAGERVVAQEEVVGDGAGKLGGLAEAAEFCIKSAA